MTITQLKKIKTALEALSKTPTTLALVIARNLSKVTQLVTSEDKHFQDAQKVFIMKDEGGKEITFIGDENMEVLKDEHGVERIFKSHKETPLSAGEFAIIKFSDPEAVKSLKIEYNDRDYKDEITFNKFNPEVLEQAIASGQISADMLIPLLGNIIPE